MSLKRADILAASLTVFQSDGVKGARMERIAQSANVSKRTLYKHFDSKEALFEAICAIVIDRLSSMEMPDFDPDRELRSQLVGVLRTYIEKTITEEFVSCSRVILPEFMRSPETARAFNDAYQGVDAPLSRFIAQAMEAGVLRTGDPATATARLLAFYKSMFLLPAILNSVGAREKTEQEIIIADSVQMFLQMYAPDAD